MTKVLLWIWQLPQNILGLLVILFSKAKRDGLEYAVWFTEMNFGVSLGDYVIVNTFCTRKTIMHERGHQRQSLMLGWLYIPIIGIPFAIGNLVDRWCHKYWVVKDRMRWYYNLPWEAWADRLGGVKR